MKDIRIEEDFSYKYDQDATGVFLVSSNIEIIRDFRKGGFRHALFDFDGTVSLIREGWQSVMKGLMLEVLSSTPEGKDEEDLEGFIDDFIGATTGKQTIYQMIGLTEETKKRGGSPLEPSEYKAEYTKRLMEKIASRREDLRCGRAKPADYLVPGAEEFIKTLHERGVALYLASGTDQKYVEEESALTGVSPYFEGNIFGARDDYKSFSKAMVIHGILEKNRLQGSSLVGFGDGFVEIDNTKTAGGTAVGVATNEKDPVCVDEGKRKRLLAVGADVIIPNFTCGRLLADLLTGGDK
ncbi:MAG: HAD family hydrolase [Abditibacteriota bacterium]|nr:HAD family hydrolase [Abditibacteriota bacterium]